MAVLYIDDGVTYQKKYGGGGDLAFTFYSYPQNSYFVVLWLQGQLAYSKRILIFPLSLRKLICWVAYFFLFFSLTTVIIYQSILEIPERGGTWGEEKEKKNVLAMLSVLVVSFFMSINSDFLCEFVSNCSILKVFEWVNF